MTIVRKLFLAAALIAQPIVYVPAQAQPGQDPVYDCWVGCIASRPGYEDWCTAECNRRFGDSPQYQPGTPERTTNPGTGRQCYGSFDYGFCDDTKPR